MPAITFICLAGNSDDTASFERFRRIQEVQGNIVYTVDYFGHCFTPEQIRAFFFKELAAMGVQSYVLVGSSFGGHISIDIANQTMLHPEGKPRIIGWVLFGTPPAGEKYWRQAFNAPNENLAAGEVPLLELLSIDRPMIHSEAVRFLSAYGWDRIDPKTLDAEDQNLYELLIERLTQSASEKLDLPRTRHDILSNLGEFGDERSIVARLSQQIPLCIIHGELDPVISLPYLESMITAGEDKVRVFEDKIHVLPTQHYAHWLDAAGFSATVDRFTETLP